MAGVPAQPLHMDRTELGRADEFSPAQRTRHFLKEMHEIVDALPKDPAVPAKLLPLEHPVPGSEYTEELEDGTIVITGRKSANPTAIHQGDLTQRFKQRMIPHEGDRNDVYLDHLGKPTVGIGHLVRPSDRLRMGDRISDQRKEALWRADSAAAFAAAQKQAAVAGISDENFILALADVNFQLGTGWNGPKNFKPTWDLIANGQYEAAAKRLEKSRWYSQTPKRVRNFQAALRALPPRRK